jgi:hypothetical protein
MTERGTEQKEEEDTKGDVWNFKIHWVTIVCYDGLGNFKENKHGTLNRLDTMQKQVENNTIRDGQTRHSHDVNLFLPVRSAFQVSDQRRWSWALVQHIQLGPLYIVGLLHLSSWRFDNVINVDVNKLSNAQ